MSQLLCAVGLDSTTPVGTSSAAPWVRRRTSTTAGGGSVPGWGTRALACHMMWPKKKKENKQKPNCFKKQEQNSSCKSLRMCVRERSRTHKISFGSAWEGRRALLCIRPAPDLVCCLRLVCPLSVPIRSERPSSSLPAASSILRPWHGGGAREFPPEQGVERLSPFGGGGRRH